MNPLLTALDAKSKARRALKEADQGLLAAAKAFGRHQQALKKAGATEAALLKMSNELIELNKARANRDNAFFNFVGYTIDFEDARAEALK